MHLKFIGYLPPTSRAFLPQPCNSMYFADGPFKQSKTKCFRRERKRAQRERDRHRHREIRSLFMRVINKLWTNLDLKKVKIFACIIRSRLVYEMIRCAHILI